LARKPNKTPEKVCKIAASLFAARGYHGTTMDDVAAGVELNKGTLYYYFPGKGDILFSICDETVQAFIGVLDVVPEGATAPQAIEFLVRAQLRMLADRPHEVSVFLHESRWLKEWLSPVQHQAIRTKETNFSQQVIALIEQGIADGFFAPVDATIASRNIMGMVAWAASWYKPKSGPSIEMIADQTVGFILAGLGMPVGQPVAR
jgi:AcrR family transcriptional regulator